MDQEMLSSARPYQSTGLGKYRSSGPPASEAMIVGHASPEPGTYTAVEHSSALARGQDPQHMAYLIGVFVFGSR